MTLLDMREHIQRDEQYEGLYLKILHNLSNTKRIRNYMSHEFGIKLSIGKAQNLATFVQLCYNLAIATRKKNFEYCLLPPPDSDYIAWQKCILSMHKARKAKTMNLHVNYTFKNYLQLGEPQLDDDDSTLSLTLPSLHRNHHRQQHDVSDVDENADGEPQKRRLSQAGLIRKELALMNKSNTSKRRISVGLVLPALS